MTAPVRLGPIVAGTLLGMAAMIGLLESGDVATACGVVILMIITLIWRLLVLHPAVQSAADPPLPGGLGVLTDRQLSHEWRRSRTLLASTRTADELARVCALRRRQLDEIERRNPHGFRRWLADGGWNDDSSLPFLGAS